MRALGPTGWCSPAYLYTRGRGQTGPELAPFRGDEWWRSPEGIWVPALRAPWESEQRRGVGFAGRKQKGGVVALPMIGTTDSLTQGTQALDTAYTAGSAGKAIGIKIVLTETLTLDKVYFFITAFTGTAANVNDIDIEIRASAAGGPDTTAPGLVDSDVKDPASATGWIAATIATPPSLTAGTAYHIIIADADGGGTDFATVLRNTNNSLQDSDAAHANFQFEFTTNGFSSNNAGNTLGAIVVTFSDGSAWGHPFTTAGTVSNNALQKGLLIDGLTEQLKIFGAVTPINNASFSGINLWTGTTGPGGSAGAQATYPITGPTTSSPTGFMFGTPPTLAKSTQYRIVFTYSGALTRPSKYDIGTGADANLKACMLGGGTWYWTEEVAGPAWSDATSSWPAMALLVEDQVAVTAAAGGGGPILLGAEY